MSSSKLETSVKKLNMIFFVIVWYFIASKCFALQKRAMEIHHLR